MTLRKPEPGMPAVVTLAGRELEVRFTLRSVRELHQKAQINLLTGAQMKAVLLDPPKLAMLLAYSLTDPETRQLVGADWIEDNVEVGMLQHMFPALVWAISGEWPDSAREPSPNGSGSAALLADQTGSGSGPTDDTTLDWESVNSGISPSLNSTH